VQEPPAWSREWSQEGSQEPAEGPDSRWTCIDRNPPTCANAHDDALVRTAENCPGREFKSRPPRPHKGRVRTKDPLRETTVHPGRLGTVTTTPLWVALVATLSAFRHHLSPPSAESSSVSDAHTDATVTRGERNVRASEYSAPECSWVSLRVCHFGGHRNASGAIQGSPPQSRQRADLRECTEAYERGPIRPDWQ